MFSYQEIYPLKQFDLNLINARNIINYASPPTADQVNNLEAAEQSLMISQTTRVQSARTSNHINYSGFGERMSRYHFARAGRGLASREITNLVITDERELKFQYTHKRICQNNQKLERINEKFVYHLIGSFRS